MFLICHSPPPSPYALYIKWCYFIENMLIGRVSIANKFVCCCKNKTTQHTMLKMRNRIQAYQRYGIQLHKQCRLKSKIDYCFGWQFHSQHVADHLLSMQWFPSKCLQIINWFDIFIRRILRQSHLNTIKRDTFKVDVFQ